MQDYPRPSLTADLVVFRGTEVLLVRRKNDPFKGQLALPGGFVNEGEEVIQAAARELFEETGIHPQHILKGPKLFGVFSKPGRDPRGWVVSVAYWAEVGPGVMPVAGDDAAEAMWVEIHQASPLAFDHEKILASGVIAGCMSIAR